MSVLEPDVAGQPRLLTGVDDGGVDVLLATSPDCGAMAVMVRRFKRGEVSARGLC